MKKDDTIARLTLRDLIFPEEDRAPREATRKQNAVVLFRLRIAEERHDLPPILTTAPDPAMIVITSSGAYANGQSARPVPSRAYRRARISCARARRPTSELPTDRAIAAERDSSPSLAE